MRFLGAVSGIPHAARDIRVRRASLSIVARRGAMPSKVTAASVVFIAHLIERFRRGLLPVGKARHFRM
jgi:hypothetical protein